MYIQIYTHYSSVSCFSCQCFQTYKITSHSELTINWKQGKNPVKSPRNFTQSPEWIICWLQLLCNSSFCVSTTSCFEILVTCSMYLQQQPSGWMSQKEEAAWYIGLAMVFRVRKVSMTFSLWERPVAQTVNVTVEKWLDVCVQDSSTLTPFSLVLLRLTQQTRHPTPFLLDSTTLHTHTLTTIVRAAYQATSPSWWLQYANQMLYIYFPKERCS